MRGMIFGTALVVAVGVGVYLMPMGSPGGGSAYSMTTGEAVSRLAKADLRVGKPPFGRLEIQVLRPSPERVEYRAAGSHAAISCSVVFSPAGEKKVATQTSCDRAAMDGAAASAANEITDLAFAEYVDSVLAGRPFDEDKFRVQSAGSVLKNLPQMQGEALRMSRQMAEQQAQWERDKGQRDESVAGEDWGSEETPYDYGQSGEEW